MGQLYKKNNVEWLVAKVEVIAPGYHLKVEDYNKDEDLIDGWLFRLEPPQDYLDWKARIEQQNNNF